MSKNPYSDLPEFAFWRRAVAGAELLDPVTSTPFKIARSEKIATVGSCFAQHLSRSLVDRGYQYLVTEPDPAAGAHPPFPARFGNVYTTRQLLQLFDRAYGLFDPADQIWRRGSAFVDPFRPRVQDFHSATELQEDRARHFSAVREMFETCDVFVFTLGLTEGWLSAVDGAAFPLAPGVAGGEPGPQYVFHNLSVDEIVADLGAFLGKLTVVNEGVKVVLTVSPVPLIATYVPRHVLVSNTYSKAVLRVAAEQICNRYPGVAYFPSYEIIVQERYFEADQRSVVQEGVAHVMTVFAEHYLGEAAQPHRSARKTVEVSDAEMQRFTEAAAVVCDEEAIDPA